MVCCDFLRTWQACLPVADLMQTGIAQSDAVAAGAVEGFSRKRCWESVISVLPPAHADFTETSGSPAWFTKVAITSSMGAPLLSVMDFQKSSAAAVP